MGWFGQRKTTLLEAFTLRRVVALPIVIAVVTAVVHGSVALSQLFAQREGQMLLGIPSWIYGVVAGLLLVLYFLIEHATRLRLQLEPRLKIAFNPDAEGIVRTPTEIYAEGKKIADDEAVYIRVTLQALSRTTVKNCVAFLTGIEKRRISTDPFIEVPVHGAIYLIPNPIDVHPRIPMPIDFLKSGRSDNKLEFSMPWPFRLRGALDEQATYRFKIDVNGDGITETIQVEVDWTGKWDAITARQV